MSDMDYRAACLIGGWLMVWAMCKSLAGLERLYDRWSDRG